MQVANDAASAKELPSCEARPGRRVNNSAAGKLQGGELREDCVEGALERGLAGGERGEASSVASALAPWSAVMLASRLASCAATKASVARPSRAFAILVSTSSGVSNPSTVKSREASALASALPRRAASRAAVVTAFRRAAAILESTSEEVSTVDCRAYAVRALASALEACSPEMEASLLASSEASAASPGLATLMSTSSGVILAAMSRECWSTTVVGGHRGQRGVVGQGDGTVHGRRAAVVGQLQVHAVRGALGGHHALQHVEGRLVCLVGEACGQRALQRGDAASWPSVVARAAAVARGAIAGASALL